jgi:hypothetical protein
MTRLIRWTILFSLLIGPFSAASVAAQAPGCQQLLPQGVYEGTSSVVMDIRGYEGDILVQEFTYNDSGQISLTVGCTVTGGAYHWHIYRTIMLSPDLPPIICEYTVDLSQPGGDVVAGANGQPRIDVRWGQGTVNPNDCVTPGPANTAATWQFSLGGPPQDRTISGDFRILYDDPSIYDYDQIAQTFRDQGFQVTLTKSWTVASAGWTTWAL